MATPTETKNVLVRGLSVTLSRKMKVAATLHHQSLQAYIIELFETHITSLEKKGIRLDLHTK